MGLQVSRRVRAQTETEGHLRPDPSAMRPFGLTGQWHISGVSANYPILVFPAFFAAAHRFRMASAILFRAAALIPLRFGGAAVSAEADIADAAFFGGRPRLFGAVPRRFFT